MTPEKINGCKNWLQRIEVGKTIKVTEDQFWIVYWVIDDYFEKKNKIRPVVFSGVDLTVRKIIEITENDFLDH